MLRRPTYRSIRAAVLSPDPKLVWFRRGSARSLDGVAARSPSQSITRLMTTVYTDIVGYSRLFALDDHETAARLKELQSGWIVPTVKQMGGHLAQTGGDSMVLLFNTVANAIKAAVEIQEVLIRHNEAHPPGREIEMRIGIDLGDIIFDETNFHGDGIIVANRLQAICPPGAVCVSRAVHDRGGTRLGLRVQSLGALVLKNVPGSVEAFVLWPDSRTGGCAIPALRRLG